MDPFVFFLVLTAAVLHAGWNALIKSGGDRWVRLALTNCLGIVLGLVFLAFVDFPNAEAWPFILSSVAVHQVYFLFVGACELFRVAAWRSQYYLLTTRRFIRRCC
mgnify:CR=1 FL=1